MVNYDNKFQLLIFRKMTDKTKKPSKKNKKEQREAESSEEESDSQAAMLQSLQEKIAEMEGKLEDRYGFT